MSEGRAIPVANDDRLPHDQAVWREYADDGEHRFDPPDGANGRQVSVEYKDGMVIQSWAHMCSWVDVVRWRYGWPPA